MKCKSKRNLRNTWREFCASSRGRKRRKFQNPQPKTHNPSLEIRKRFRRNQSPTKENMARDLHVKHRNITRPAKQQMISQNVSQQARDWDREPLRKKSKKHEVVTCLLWRNYHVLCTWPWSTQNLVPETASESLRIPRKRTVARQSPGTTSSERTEAGREREPFNRPWGDTPVDTVRMANPTANGASKGQRYCLGGCHFPGGDWYRSRY